MSIPCLERTEAGKVEIYSKQGMDSHIMKIFLFLKYTPYNFDNFVFFIKETYMR